MLYHEQTFLLVSQKWRSSIHWSFGPTLVLKSLPQQGKLRQLKVKIVMSLVHVSRNQATVFQEKSVPWTQLSWLNSSFCLHLIQINLPGSISSKNWLKQWYLYLSSSFHTLCLFLNGNTRTSDVIIWDFYCCYLLA